MSRLADEIPTQTASSKGTRRDLQRDALAQLVLLAARCAETEERLENELNSTVSAANRALERLSRDLQESFESRRKQVEAEAEQKLAKADVDYAAAFNQVQASDREARARLVAHADAVEAEIKKQYQQAQWLAESLFEASAAAAAQDSARAKKRQGERHEQLDERLKRADDLIVKYGVGMRWEASSEAAEPSDDLEKDYEHQVAEADRHLERLASLKLPWLFVGWRPWAAGLLLLLGAAVTAHLATGTMSGLADLSQLQVNWRAVGWTVAGTAVAGLVLGFALRLLSERAVRGEYLPLRDAIHLARVRADQRRQQVEKAADQKHEKAVLKRDRELAAASEKFKPLALKARQSRQSAISSQDAAFKSQLARTEQIRDQTRQEVQAAREATLRALQDKLRAELGAARDNHDRTVEQARQHHAAAVEQLRREWKEGLEQITAPIVDERDPLRVHLNNWDDPRWDQWRPPREFVAAVRFGELGVDLRQVTDRLPKTLEIPDRFALPAILAFPRQASLMIHTDRAGRAPAMHAVRMLMTRLLTSLPPGRVRFTLLDPVGLGESFAAFMHLADHDDALVGGRIWTEAQHIEERLSDLTEHMETVIQKYLRNEFETIDQYNEQAGELVEPYRILVIADFPAGFTPETLRRLASIAASGARCGVYVIIVRDVRQPLPPEFNLEDVEAACVNLVYHDGKFVWRDDVFSRFELTIDPPPGDERLTGLLHEVGKAAREASRVQVPFESIAPRDGQLWSWSCTDELRVPIGQTGATRQQQLRLGRGVAQHVLVAGKTGSGKSTLLHALVTNLALWYPPSEVNFYLVDFKKGVEFKTYATERLPHARAIAVESDREFGLSVLQRLDAELTRRGELFRKLGVQDLPGYRGLLASGKTAEPMPRVLLVIDEFQEFFSEDDRIAQDAALLLDRLVRQGRAFGMHVLLGSQTIGGSSGLSRSTLGQMAVRIALQTSEADSQIILGDGNSAARLLSRPGEAVYNDAGGLVEANSPFQVAWLSDSTREQLLRTVRNLAEQRRVDLDTPVVFEGNAPADPGTNVRLLGWLRGEKTASQGAPLAFLGEPVAIKPPTSVAFQRQSGANLLVIGQNDENATAVSVLTILSIVSQVPAATVFVMDGTAQDAPGFGLLYAFAHELGSQVRMVDYRQVPDVISQVHAEMTRRSGSQQGDPPVFVVVHGLQRFRMLRKSEDSFGFSTSASEAPDPAAQFAEILKEGSAVGVHVVAWADTYATVERTLDRSSIREFDLRVLFQMSANDSSSLIDSPAANRLGLHRAILYSEEQGIMEKFRPYACPTIEWLRTVRNGTPT
jgi:hypothetical protein